MIRDEVSKIIDVRIPPNGYRKYIKTISRTGGFQQLQYEDSFIALFEAVEALQKQVDELTLQLEKNKYPFGGGTSLSVVAAASTGESARGMQAIGEGIANDGKGLMPGALVCATCGKECKSELGRMSHERSHKDEKSTTGSKTTTE